MATVNLGRIKFVWQGAYNGATAYVADDVVSYNGSSYICILASTGNLPTNTTYWNQMSSAGTNGTNGTDLTTTLTTQGDIVYRDASGLQRLGAGTSGQFLKTNGAGANPAWSTVQAGLIKVSTFVDSTRRVLPDASDSGSVYSFTFNKSQNATSSKLVITGIVPGFGQNSNQCGIYFDCLTTGITSHNTNDSFAFHGVQYGCANSAAESDNLIVNKTYEDTTNLGSGNHTFEWGWRTRNGVAAKPYVIVNYNNNDDARQHQSVSVFQVFEIAI